jgi:hypothetical protein
MFVQIAIFKLKAGVSRKVFVALTEQMVSWLMSREGFVAYELYEGVASWSDRIVWSNKRYAEEGLKAFVLTEIAKEIMDLVENDFNSFMGQQLVTV